MYLRKVAVSPDVRKVADASGDTVHSGNYPPSAVNSPSSAAEAGSVLPIDA